MQQTQWSPSTPGIAACAVLGLVMAAGAVTVVTDAPGRILGRHCRGRTLRVCKHVVAGTSEAGNHPDGLRGARVVDTHVAAARTTSPKHPHHGVSPHRAQGAAARDRHHRRRPIAGVHPMGSGHQSARRARRPDRRGLRRLNRAARPRSTGPLAGALRDRDRLDHDGFGRPVAAIGRASRRWRRRPSATPRRRPRRRSCACGSGAASCRP